ncbi:Flp pilus assembly protein CpaB [bacterium]|nr:MAG: Flp pilus assembly protein CpaB [bacterium]
MRTTLTGLTSRRPFTLLGIVLALLVIAAFVLVALNAGTASSSPPLTVVVAAKELPPRLPIEAASLELKAIPVPLGYPKLYFTKIQDVQGMIPLVTIVPGQAVTSSDVAKPSEALGSQSAYLPIPAGFVALTIPTSEQQGVADYIQPDDYISVIATVSSSGKVASKTIFTNLHVIRVGMQASSGTSAASTASSLTVVVSECQAEVITWFLTYASLKYSLESFHDYLGPGSQTPDPGCPTVTAARGVTLQTIQAAYPSLF